MTITSKSLAESIATGMTNTSNNFEDALAVLTKNGAELSMQEILATQIKVGISSLYVTMASSIEKEWIDSAKGACQKVG